MDRVWSVLVLALAAGCAPPVVGGTWHTGTVNGAGISAQDVTLEFLDASSVRVTIVQGQAQACPERYTRNVTGSWFVNGVGEVIVNATCDHEVEHCDRSGGVVRTYNLCELLPATVYPGRFVSRNDTLVSSERPTIVLTRR